MNKKRHRWRDVCLLWAVIWGFFGVFFFWPLLVLSFLSLALILLPVGMSETEEAPAHDPNAWRTETRDHRPWKHSNQ